MKRTLFSLMTTAVVAFAAASANAAVSLSITSPDESNNYTPGSVITLQVKGQADGGETANTIVGSILYSNTLFTSPTTSQVDLDGAGTNWGPGVISCNTTRCQAFNQITPPGPALPGNIAAGTIISQLSFTVASTATPQSFTFNWQTTPSTQRVNFFGLNPLTLPGYTINIVAVPEPTTMAMLGLGLFGLALAGRRR
ncbi:MAG TPA: PEP-CTERM sorting domain-containing protein [Myxococcota bacterium]|nr:PEP-CTERM sorting domain-containing protein [Myxococcota bacterium]